MFDAPQLRKRTLNQKERKSLYEKANGLCEGCGKQIDFVEMLAGHKHAYSKGGKTNLANSACLCYKCNKLQGTDEWEDFLYRTGRITTIQYEEMRKANKNRLPQSFLGKIISLWRICFGSDEPQPKFSRNEEICFCFASMLMFFFILYALSKA